jgi:helix-turn-helix protein
MNHSSEIVAHIRAMDHSTIITMIRILGAELADRDQRASTYPNAKGAAERYAARVARRKRSLEYDKAFGGRLRAARIAAGKSEQEGAAACGVGLATYMRYENGHHASHRCDVVGFAGAFGVSLDWLIGADRPMFREGGARPVRTSADVLAFPRGRS